MMMQPIIRIENTYRRVVAQFICLGDGLYWGGRSADEFDEFTASHYVLQLPGMLDLIGRLAQVEAPHCYSVSSPEGGICYLLPDIQADELARVIGCQPEQIVAHFRLLVRLTG